MHGQPYLQLSASPEISLEAFHGGSLEAFHVACTATLVSQMCLTFAVYTAKDVQQALPPACWWRLTITGPCPLYSRESSKLRQVHQMSMSDYVTSLCVVRTWLKVWAHSSVHNSAGNVALL